MFVHVSVFLMHTHSFNAVYVYSCHLTTCAGKLCVYQWMLVMHVVLLSHVPFTHMVHLLWKGVKAVGLLGVWESHSHA